MAAPEIRVLVFDIDGTLTDTNRVDDACFRAAISAVLPTAEYTSFESFSEFTDSAILAEACAAHATDPYEEIEPDVQREFFSRLEAAARSDPGSFRPIAGAREVLGLVRDAGWTPAIATGGWRRSAEFKLGAAEVGWGGVVLATSSEAVRRVDIIRRAVDEAAAGRVVRDVVYVGDGVWDVKACSEMGIGFIGRSTPESEPRLVGAGARAMVRDFGNLGDLWSLLSDPASLRPRDAIR